MIFLSLFFIFFFFQAEDGIRDLYVTGVQTCALPISLPALTSDLQGGAGAELGDLKSMLAKVDWNAGNVARGRKLFVERSCSQRSEERRVGKECRSGWGGYH